MSTRALPKLVNHVHLPVQSGSDRVLARMKRGYTVLEYKSIVRRLRQVRPRHCAFVGLHRRISRREPGRFRPDDAADRAASGSMPASAFVYSKRPGTPAADLVDETPQATKLARLAQLQAAIEANANRIAAAMVGSTQRILVEGASKNGSKGDSKHVQRRVDGPHRKQSHHQFSGRSRRATAWWGRCWTYASRRRCRIRCAGNFAARATALMACDESPLGGDEIRSMRGGRAIRSATRRAAR